MNEAKNFPTPPLRVSRPVSACSRCRLAKIKCDGKLPSCSACEKSGRGRECSSANDQFAKGKERNYVASLEIRVERLERQLSEARRRKISVTMLDLSSMQSPLSPTSRSVSRKPKSQRKEASDVDDLVSDFGFLSVNATARDFHGFTREMSFARLVLSTSSLEAMPKATGAMLPPRYTTTSLIQYYLDNVFTLYPFVSESAIFAALDTQQRDGVHASPMDHWTVRMVTAISFASLSRKRGDAQYSDAVVHAAEAFTYAEKVLQPGSMFGIQALLLLVIYAMSDPHHFNSWYLIGIASRVMVDIGLHQDPPDNLPSQKSQIQLRRRIYHSVYALDRAISMVHRRAFSFTDDSASVAPEVATKEEVFRQALEPAKQVLRLRQLESSVYQKLYFSDRQIMQEPWSTIAAGLGETRAWAKNLPDSISRPLQTLFLSEVLYMNVLFLSAPGATELSYQYGNATLFENVVQYAETTSLVIQGPEKLAFYTSHDLLRASFVATRFLEVLEAGGTYLSEGPASDRPSTASMEDLPLPPPPYRGAQDLGDLAIGTITILDRILKHLCVQYGYSEPWQEFHSRSLSSIGKLQSSRERWATGAIIESGPTALHVPSEQTIPAAKQPTTAAAANELLWNMHSADYLGLPMNTGYQENT